MYVPKQFLESKVEELHRIVRENSFGMLVMNSVNGLDANHLPFLMDSDGDGSILIAHVARANPVWREVRDGDNVLVIFRGVQGYISPSWYPGKQETHRRVPTWNYEVVHAHGAIYVHDDVKFVQSVVARLTRQHEAEQIEPWKMGDAPPDFIAEELSQIVGIEIRVRRLEGNRKLNQHHQTRDREGVICWLETQGNYGLAQAMKDTAPHAIRTFDP